MGGGSSKRNHTRDRARRVRAPREGIGRPGDGEARGGRLWRGGRRRLRVLAQDLRGNATIGSPSWVFPSGSSYRHRCGAFPPCAVFLPPRTWVPGSQALLRLPSAATRTPGGLCTCTRSLCPGELVPVLVPLGRRYSSSSDILLHIVVDSPHNTKAS